MRDIATFPDQVSEGPRNVVHDKNRRCYDSRRVAPSGDLRLRGHCIASHWNSVRELFSAIMHLTSTVNADRLRFCTKKRSKPSQ